MLFDTHAHPYITFKKSPETILENFFSDTDNLLVSIACDRETSVQSIGLAKKYSGIYATIGFHPCDLPYTSLNSLQSSQGTSLNSLQSSHNTSLNSLLPGEIELQINELQKLYQRNKQYIVAVGETGLDYYHLTSISEKTGLSTEDIKHIQSVYFRAQIRLARELKLPFVIHSRESNDDVLDILREEQATDYVFHCFSGDIDFAYRVLDQNPKAMFGLGGTLTFRKSHALHELASRLPLKHILLETDAPFLTPEPLRGREENEPLNVSHVLKNLQELRDESSEEVERTVYENGRRFYGIH